MKNKNEDKITSKGNDLCQETKKLPPGMARLNFPCECTIKQQVQDPI